MNFQEFIEGYATPEAGSFLLNERIEREKIILKKIYIDMVEDLIAGIVLNQIVYWHTPNEAGEVKLTVFRDGFAWIFKRREDWWEECRITPKQVDKACKLLEDLDVIRSHNYKRNNAPTKHFRINWEAFLPLFQQAKATYGEKVGFRHRSATKNSGANRSNPSNSAFFPNRENGVNFPISQDPIFPIRETGNSLLGKNQDFPYQGNWKFPIRENDLYNNETFNETTERQFLSEKNSDSEPESRSDANEVQWLTKLDPAPEVKLVSTQQPIQTTESFPSKSEDHPNQESKQYSTCFATELGQVLSQADNSTPLIRSSADSRENDSQSNLSNCDNVEYEHPIAKQERWLKGGYKQPEWAKKHSGGRWVPKEDFVVWYATREGISRNYAYNNLSKPGLEDRTQGSWEEYEAELARKRESEERLAVEVASEPTKESSSKPISQEAKDKYLKELHKLRVQVKAELSCKARTRRIIPQ